MAVLKEKKENCQVKGEEMKGRGKREKRAGEVVSLARGRIEVPFCSALLCQALQRGGDPRVFLPSCCRGGSSDH